MISLPELEFHLSRPSRHHYEFNGDLAVNHRPDLKAVHELASRMNQRQRTARPGDLFALVLLHQVFHRMVEHYRTAVQPKVLADGLEMLTERVGQDAALTLRQFTSEFPPRIIRESQSDVESFLRSPLADRTQGELVVEQMMLVYLNNRNPACVELHELFDEHSLSLHETYLKMLSELREFLARQPVYGKLGMTLFDILESPLKASPNSLSGQLQFILDNWDLPLDEELRRLMTLAQDLIREDQARRGPGPVQTFVPDFRREHDLPERYSSDTDWMPRTVLIAKSVFVWLDQLRKEYRRDIWRLDQIPDEELKRLADRGFTALWLIGLWERSRASLRIKHRRGNVEAAASAYSLYDYTIAHELGGDEALERLRERALNYGIRLACDVVPNHMGIDSRWVLEHPDWFLQLDRPPYPDYHFSGPDLSSDPRISLRIEDGYWTQTNAAVVFEWRDNWTGQVRYIYHGNDGTSTPWNDTAQLNFLMPEVRRAVTDLILSVARRFSLIRFDAAMTLTRMHYQRLWFPPPGEGGAIPSRSWYGMTKQDFDRAMPEEFWRGVVDRVNAEAPDTLLLAEAFWLTEGLFVRTLGMHRVYNSAFMNMLKMEENAKYRQLIRNVLAFDSRILERYVNFMSNPDEDTAVEQFGKGDKYFGVATMMCTLPGLPMFGHGQIEGYTEKYGHEYRRAYYDEVPDALLVERHEREVFPILRRRHLFSRTDQLVLHDVHTPEGHVNEDIFAFSNRTGDSHTLMVYHNRYAEADGWIHNLAARLGLQGRDNIFVIFRDLAGGKEFIRETSALHRGGFYVRLRAYQYHVFTDFHEVDDRDGWYRRVADRLSGQPALSIEREVQREKYAPLTAAYRQFVSEENLKALFLAKRPAAGRAKTFAREASPFVELAVVASGASGDPQEVLTRTETAARYALTYGLPLLAKKSESAKELTLNHRLLGAWVAASQIGALDTSPGADERASDWFHEWFLDDATADEFVNAGAQQTQADREVRLLRILIRHQDVAQTFDGERRYAGMAALLDDPMVRTFLQINSHGGVEWYNAESMAELLGWLAAISAVRIQMKAELSPQMRRKERDAAAYEFNRITDVVAISEYQVGRLRELLKYPGSRTRRIPVKW